MMKRFDCKPARTTVRITLWASLATGLMLAHAPPPTPLLGTEPEEAPPLSLETLYHPKEKFSYDGKAPQTHWVGGEQNELIVRREESWMVVDLQTGEEAAWPVVDDLESQLLALDGVKPEQARSGAMQVAGEMDSPHATTLVRLGEALAVVAPDSPARWLTRDGSQWDNATLDPADRRVAYTTDGDLFVRDVASGRSLRLTNDGSETRLNGILDWMYQEEIFGRGNYRGFWFSHDGQWLAMLRIDISQIEPYVLAKAASERGTGLVRRYSKPGDPIPHAELFVWDLRQADQGQIPPPRRIERSTQQRERIITGVWWSSDRQRLLYSISDRVQSWRELRSVDADALVAGSGEGGGQSTRLLREESPAWVEPPAAPAFLDDGSIVWRSELPSGYNRLYRIREDGGVTTPLSPEGFNVEKFFVADDSSFALVTGNAEGGNVERHLYRLELGTETGGADPDRMGTLKRLTNKSGWNQAEFSPAGHAAVIRHSTPIRPPSVAVIATAPGERPSAPATGNESDSGTRSSAINSASEAVRADGIELEASKLAVPGGMIEPQLFQIETDDGVRLPAMLIRPPNAAEEEGKEGERIPVVIEVYGGPRAPIATAQWRGTRSLYREWLARHGIATLLVDNRSSGGRGLAETWTIQHRVGEVELDDLLAAVEWLKSQRWVDSQKLAIRGWSFGGFMTLMAMTQSGDFAAGIAGGSVADWREYDSFYTERYMGLPADNREGYRNTAPVNAAADLNGRLLLIHGEMDDNVHPANTLRMAQALQSAGKLFDLMIYPGAAHGIHDPQQVWHLARTTDRFLREHLGVQP